MRSVQPGRANPAIQVGRRRAIPRDRVRRGSRSDRGVEARGEPPVSGQTLVSLDHRQGHILHRKCGRRLTLEECHDTVDQREMRFYCLTCLEHIYLCPLSLGCGGLDSPGSLSSPEVRAAE